MWTPALGRFGGKMKRKILIGILSFFGIINIWGKDYQKEAVEFMQNGNYEQCLSVLKEWESKEPKNSEINIMYWNYYVYKDAKQITAMGKMPDGRYGMYPKTVYNKEDVKTAISYLDKILKTYSNRMDIIDMKCWSYNYIEDYNSTSELIVKTIKQSKKNNNEWTWTKNEAPSKYNKPEGEALLFQMINNSFRYIDLQFEENKEIIHKIIESELSFYPENIYGLNHASVYYQKTGDYKRSIEVLSRAAKINPHDYIVIGNLAYSYELAEDYKNAKKWYEYMLNMENPEAIEYGKQGLEAIKAKN